MFCCLVCPGMDERGGGLGLMDREAIENMIDRPLTDEERDTINWVNCWERETQTNLMALMLTASTVGYRRGVEAAVNKLARVRA